MTYNPKERAQALVVLRESEGWKVIQSEILKPAITGSINSMMNRKKTRGVADVAYYQGKYDLASKITALVDKWIEDGRKVVKEEAKDAKD